MKTNFLIALATSLTALANAAEAATAERSDAAAILVIGPRSDDVPEKLDHILPEVAGAHVNVTKTTTMRPSGSGRALPSPPRAISTAALRSSTRPAMPGMARASISGTRTRPIFSVSQGYRPMRFFDVASPFSNINPGGVPKPAKSLAWEAGVHGTLAKGLFYDFSLFWIDFKNRVETIVLSQTESIYRNSGDTRHRGLEAELSHNLLAGRGDGLHLTAFGNVSLLDAKFTKSNLANRVGNKPAFAPDVTAKYGVTLRQDAAFTLSLTGTTISSQYFQGSNLPVGTAVRANYIPAKVPAHTVLDLSGDLQLWRNLRVLAGVSNLTDKHYYNRVFQNGIEPGAASKVNVGLAAGL